ncbi:unnamed protein product [Cylicocyclus nassatus]|uniref:Tudor domain-containing protein n=1 Tax=Cylicocyclus nassatus TaxID=53992 RepID=A0AA36M4T6_CYLNA|nr:unnamed protein product [Cylicocyclus nassatus]
MHSSRTRFSVPNPHQAYNFRLDEIDEENEPHVNEDAVSPRRGSREEYADNAANTRRSGSVRSPPFDSAIAARSSISKYPVLERNQLRTRCRDIMQEKSSKIFIDRLEKEGYLRWSTLNKLEKRLVDYNPAFFQLSIDLPDFVEPRVSMIRTPHPEQVDVTGSKGGLRAAIDEDFAWLPDATFTFDAQKCGFRECAIMAFTPPRCFIMCDEVGTELEERVDAISDDLRAFYSKSLHRASDNIDVRPGVALVGLRGDTFLRIVVLEADIHISTKVRCSCMDRNAIYSFDRDELFPLPDKFSAEKLPVNIFLARFRGTHFVYKEKYDEIIEGLCQPNKDEGLVAFVTCAVYGLAPDGLVIIDATMPNGGWVSSVLVRSGLVAAMARDPNIAWSSEQAEQAIKSKHEKEMLSNSVICEEVSDDQKNEGMSESGADIAESVESECDVPVKEAVVPDEMSENESKYDYYDDSGNAKEEMREEFEKMREEVLSGSSNASSTYEIHPSTSSVGHPEDEVKVKRESCAIEAVPPCADYAREEVESEHSQDEEVESEHSQDEEVDEHSQDEDHDVVEEKSPKRISPAAEESIENIKIKEANDEEEIEQLESKMQDLRASEELGTEAQEAGEAPEVEYSHPGSPPPSSDGETVEEATSDELGLKNALEAYLSVRQLSKESSRFKAAMDASILSAINCASGIFISKMVDDGNYGEDMGAQVRSRSELEFVKMIQMLGQKPKN